MNALKIISVNVGQRERLEVGPRSRMTGIFKRPVEGPVEVSPAGLAGDAIVNTKHHGGEDQAVYIYRQEDYDWWAAEHGRSMTPGELGENLTVSGLPSPDMLVGSRLAFETVELEITAPRVPCRTLSDRMKDHGFSKKFFAAKRPGFYARVLTPGPITAGESFTLKEPNEHRVSILEIFAHAKKRPSEADRRRFLAAPIDIRTRRRFEM